MELRVEYVWPIQAIITGCKDFRRYDTIDGGT